MRKIKIGIDVGGTFTHAVALDIADFSLIGKTCVPTTHKAKEGVAGGVLKSLQQLLQENKIKNEEIVLLAHSTTQATNALLEGDKARVGVIGMGKGLEGKIAAGQTKVSGIELSPGKYLDCEHAFIDVSNPPAEHVILGIFEQFRKKGVEVVVTSEAFGIDDPVNEHNVANLAVKKGFLATAASDISKLYGLRIRTRTAVINASMLPKMLETARMTEESVRKSGIRAPLMIMRSDGGIMDLEEMRKRPILTMLSGPAAGVAAALMYARISDGIFVEVGGTSTDISVIKNGKPQIKTAQIANNRLYIRTLDVRTIGIAGGSMPRISGNSIVDVGPRSAHIANVAYTSFNDLTEIKDLNIEFIRPLPADPPDYLCFTTEDTGKQRYTVTPTAASQYLGFIQMAGITRPIASSIKNVLDLLAAKLDTSSEKISRKILQVCAAKVEKVLNQLIRQYKLDRELIELVGGGGGAEAIVPFTAQFFGAEHRIVENTDVISAIGVALGIIRDSVEKSIINPTENDLIELRQAAANSVLSMGAVPESVEVSVEIDSKNKKVIATATGSSELRSREMVKSQLSGTELKQIAAKSIKMAEENIESVGDTGMLHVYRGNRIKKRLFGLIKSVSNRLRVIDNEGVIRLQLQNAVSEGAVKTSLKSKLAQMIESHSTFGDAGALVPDIYVLVSSKIIDMSGLVLESQITALLDIEMKQVADSEKLVIIASQKL